MCIFGEGIFFKGSGPEKALSSFGKAQILKMEINIAFLTILLLPLFIFILKQFVSNRPPLPPGPTPWPILGNIFHLGNMPHVSLSNLSQTYGPLMLLRLGKQYLIVGSSPSAAGEILKTHDRILSARYIPSAAPATAAELNHSSIFWTEECNDGWKSIRTLLRTELVSAKALDSQACMREKKTMDMVDFLRAKDGQVVKIKDLVYATVFNIISNVLLSRDLIDLEEESAGDGLKLKALLKGLTQIIASPNLSDLFPFLSKLDLQGLRKRSKVLSLKVQAIWDPIIQDKRKRDTSLNPQDFLDSLIKNGYTDNQINQLLMELFNAATDTTTTTIEWTMAELVKNPESLKKVREELGKEINQDLPKESHLVQLPYLQACIKETLRLHPPVPLLLPHRAAETCQVMNYTIPQNAQIVVNVWAIGRDPSIWDEPLKFRPKRFLSSTLDFKGSDFELLPFGAGRRICPGLPMAARVLPLVIASLVHFFDWSLPHGKDPRQLDMNEKLDAALLLEQPLLLIPEPRR